MHARTTHYCGAWQAARRPAGTANPELSSRLAALRCKATVLKDARSRRAPSPIVPRLRRLGMVRRDHAAGLSHCRRKAWRLSSPRPIGRNIASVRHAPWADVYIREAPSDVSIGRVDGQQPNRNERVSSVGSSSSSATSGDCRSPMLPAESKRSTSAKPARSRRK
jgi:hypothetical protein